MEYGFTDSEILWMAEKHVPSEKYDGRLGTEVARAIDKHRPNHDHAGVACDKVGCPNTPDWMRRPSAQAEQGESLLDSKVELKLSILRERALSFEGLKNLPPPTWRIRNVLPTEGLVVVYGHPGTYKSFLTLDWALCVDTGCPWFGHEVAPGKVLYVIAESPAGMGQRARAWEQVRAQIPSSITFLPMAVNLLDGQWAEALVRFATELGIDLTILDTLSRMLIGGNENSPESMTLAVDAAERLHDGPGATVVVHHKPRDGSNPRGHTSLEGAAETSIEVKAEEGRITLISNKAKNAPEFDDIHLTPNVVDLGGDPLDTMSNSLVLDLGDPAAGSGENERKILQALSNVFPLTGATAAELMKAAGLSSSSFYYSVNRLLENGLVKKMKSGRYFLSDGGAAG